MQELSQANIPVVSKNLNEISSQLTVDGKKFSATHSGEKQDVYSFGTVV
jgi:hypothetical protein